MMIRLPTGIQRTKRDPEYHMARAMGRMQKLLDAPEYTLVTQEAVAELVKAGKLIESACQHIRLPDDDRDEMLAVIECMDARKMLDSDVYRSLPYLSQDIALLRLNLTTVIAHLGGEPK